MPPALFLLNPKNLPAGAPASPRLVWLCDVFGCAEDATGKVITPLAEELARERPSAAWTVRGTPGNRNGVEVRRLPATRFGRARPALLGLNLATTSMVYSIAPRFGLRRGDVAMVVTSPRLLPFGAVQACAARGVPAVVVVHDVYPDVLAAVGWLQPGSLLFRLYRRSFDVGLRRAARVVVLGEDMRCLLLGRLPEIAGRLRVIPNWADTVGIRPTPAGDSRLRQQLGLGDRFVALFAGTLGRTHDGDILLDAAERVRGDDRIRFLVLASGVHAADFARRARCAGLDNVVCHPPVPRAGLGDALAAGDVGVLGFRPGMTGVSVPSRIYNIMAAARPLLLAGDERTEAATLIRDHGLGWVVQPGDGDAFAGVLRAAAGAPAACRAMGAAARRLAEERFPLVRIAGAYRRELEALAAAGGNPAS